MTSTNGLVVHLDAHGDPLAFLEALAQAAQDCRVDNPCRADAYDDLAQRGREAVGSVVLPSSDSVEEAFRFAEERSQRLAHVLLTACPVRTSMPLSVSDVSGVSGPLEP